MKRGFLIGLVILGYATSMIGFGFAASLNVNLLINPGFESGLTGWTTDNHGTLRSSDPLPHSGNYYLMGSDRAQYCSTSQIVDLLSCGFTTSDLDEGALLINYGGWQSGYKDQTDSGKIMITLKNTDNTVLESQDLGWFYSNSTWTLLEGELALNPGTRYIEFKFDSIRYNFTHNDGYLDDAFLKLNPVPIPGAIWLLGSGIIGMIGIRRKFRK